MKYVRYLLLATAALLVSSCNQSKSAHVVKQAYVHKYGVPLAKETWDSQGRSGQIITTKRDGVVITESFEFGQLHGDTTFSFPHSKRIHKLQTYLHGSLGKDVENYPSGLPMREETYKDSLTTITRWYESGIPQLVELYETNSLLKGEYFNTDHELESEVAKGEGMRVRRDAFGNLLSKDTIEDGELVLRSTFFNNGDPHELIPFAANEVHGQKKIFSMGGMPKSLESWVMGSQEGLTTLYENGQKVIEVTFHNGQRDGVEKRYREDDIIVEEVSWKDGKKHGPKKVYVEGEVTTNWYHEDQLVNRTMFLQRNRT